MSGEERRHWRPGDWLRGRRDREEPGPELPREVAEGGSYRKGENVSRVNVPAYPEPDDRIRRALGGPGELWQTPKLDRADWVDTGRPETWPDRSRERRPGGGD